MKDEKKKSSWNFKRILAYFIFLLIITYLVFCQAVILLSGGGIKTRVLGIPLSITSTLIPIKIGWILFIIALILFLSSRGFQFPKGKPEKGEAFSRLSPRFFIFLMGAVILLAFFFRVYRLSLPPFDFHTTRQFHSALLAREFYYQFKDIGEIPFQNRELVDQGRKIFEPPIMELLAVLSYRIIGRENLNLPRFYSIFFWMLGAFPLYLLLRRLSGLDGALVGTAFYLLLPFSIYASRVFMHDPLMNLFFIISLYYIFEFARARIPKNFLLMVFFMAFTAFIKIPALLLYLPVMLYLLFHYPETGRLLRKHFFVCLLFFLPMVINLVYLLILGGSSYGVKGRFIPSLFLTADFYRNWWRIVREVVGISGLLLGAAGIFCFPKSQRSMIACLFSGYLLLGLVFNYHISSHNYYSIPLIALCALSTGKLGEVALAYFKKAMGNKALKLFLITLGLTLTGFSLDGVFKFDLSGAGEKIALYQRLGEELNHSSRVLLLAENYGLPLRYYGWVAGKFWPIQWDLRYEKLRTGKVLPAELRLKEMIKTEKSEYFIITEPEEFEKQEGLKKLLENEYSKTYQSDEAVIYKLK